MLRGEPAELGARTWIMGIVNVTPDSFSDGGRFASASAAVAHAQALVAAGADIVDVGGESTRPGARPVPADEERRRVVPVVDALRREGVRYISVDTSKAEVARAALEAGADLVNDVSGFAFDPALPRVVAEAGAAAIVMHLRGGFADMHREPRYNDVMFEVMSELEQAIAKGRAAGLAREQMIIDPGIGFSKTAAHSLEVLRRLPELQKLDRPSLLGPSRKSFMASATGARSERAWGTAAAVTACVLDGAHIVRVHDVREMCDVVRVADAIRGDA